MNPRSSYFLSSWVKQTRIKMESESKTKIAIIVHGGAGHISKSRYDSKLIGVQRAVRIGYNILKDTNNPVDAVEAAIKDMELDDGFNAGYGSMLASNGEVEMDAIIIRGSDLKAGAVGAIKHVAHPISVSKAVMEKTPHVLLVGEGAEEFAKAQGFPQVTSEQLTSPHAKQLLDLILKKQATVATEISGGTLPPSLSSKDEGSSGTVGAIAINSLGQIAAGTSTGGIAAKMPGRVGDTPIIGGGTLCDDTCGVSATGLGEAIMRACVSSRVAEFLRQGYPPNDACLMALEYMTSKIPEGDGGAIVITKSGEIGYDFNSPQMAWAYIKEDDDDKLHYGIEKGDDFTLNVFDK